METILEKIKKAFDAEVEVNVLDYNDYEIDKDSREKFFKKVESILKEESS